MASNKNRFFIEVTKLGQYIDDQRRLAITRAKKAQDELDVHELVKQMAKYEALGDIAIYLNEVPWKTLNER